MVPSDRLALGVGGGGKPGKTLLVKSSGADFSMLRDVMGYSADQINNDVLIQASLTAATAAARASLGDTVKIAPGYAETVIAAGGIALNVAGVSYEALGIGHNRPVISFSTVAGASITISANNVAFKGIVLQGAGTQNAFTNILNVTGTDSDIDVEWNDLDATHEAAVVVYLNTAHRAKLNLKHNGFTAGAAVVRSVRLNGVAGARINLDAYGVVSTAWVNFADVASTNVIVTGNMFTQSITDSSKLVVDTVGGSTWDAIINDTSRGATVEGSSNAAFAVDDVSAIAAQMNVPTANSAANTLERDAVGNKTDTAVLAPSALASLLAYAKGLIQAAPHNKSVVLASSDLTGSPTRFTIANGPIRVKSLAMLMTTGHSAVGNTCKFQFTPTGGAATDLCGATDLNNAGAQQLFNVDGTKATALVKTTDVGILAAGQKQTSDIVLGSGVITQVFSAGPPVAGAAVVTLEWVPQNILATVS